MATNADTEEQEQSQTEEDRTDLIKKAKEEAVEPQADESDSEEDQEDTGDSEEGQTDDATEDSESQEEESTFTKGDGFDWVKGETPEEYARSLEQAYSNSTKEALKWKNLYEGKETDEPADNHPILEQAKRREEMAMQKEYEQFTDKYPQMSSPDNASKLEKRVLTISKAIQEDEKREPSFAEVLTLAATSFGWKPDNSEQVAAAAKDVASSSARTEPPKATPKSKISKEMIETAKKYFPNKSEAELIKELEPHVS